MRFLHQNKLLVLCFALVLGTTVYFAFGAYQNAVHYRAASQDRVVQGWMTPRYVAHTWHLPRETIQALGFDRDTDGPRPLRKIAEERGIPVETLIAEIEAAIAAHLAELQE